MNTTEQENAALRAEVERLSAQVERVRALTVIANRPVDALRFVDIDEILEALDEESR